MLKTAEGFPKDEMRLSRDFFEICSPGIFRNVSRIKARFGLISMQEVSPKRRRVADRSRKSRTGNFESSENKTGAHGHNGNEMMLLENRIFFQKGMQTRLIRAQNRETGECPTMGQTSVEMIPSPPQHASDLQWHSLSEQRLSFVTVTAVGPPARSRVKQTS